MTDSPEHTEDSLEMMRAFMRISDPKKRRDLIDLARKLAQDSSTKLLAVELPNDHAARVIAKEIARKTGRAVSIIDEHGEEIAVKGDTEH